MTPRYLRNIPPLPEDLLAKSEGRRMSRADALRFRQAMAYRMAAIRAARERANVGRRDDKLIRPEPPYGAD